MGAEEKARRQPSTTSGLHQQEEWRTQRHHSVDLAGLEVPAVPRKSDGHQ